MKPYILVVDDEPDIRRLVREILEDEGYAVAIAKDGASARASVEARMPNLVLLDIWMPDVDGISLLKELFEKFHLQCPVIMMSGHGTVEAAVEATRLGAHDFIEKPLSLSKLLLTVDAALSAPQFSSKQVSYHRSINKPVELIGKSYFAKQLKDQLDHCVQHDVTVLIKGELGVGKAHSARYIHSHSHRKTHSYVELHTATMMGENGSKRLEMLMGHEQQSIITQGYLEQANGGTLYIDDVAELDKPMQAALYGALASPTIFRVNGSAAFQVDVRLVVATRYDLEQEVRAGRFREDLFHSINAYPLKIVPLREHSEDVSELLQYYASLFADEEGLPYRNFSLAAQNRLRNYVWSGNILELENLVRRILMLGGSATIELSEVETILEQQSQTKVSNLTDSQTVLEFDLPLRQAREQFEKAYLEFHLKKTQGSVGKVAKLAGMERTHLYRKLRSLGIDTKQIVPAKDSGS